MQLHILTSSLLLLLAGDAVPVTAHPSPVSKLPVRGPELKLKLARQTSQTNKYCAPQSSICYLQYATTSASYPIFRIAVPDVTSAPFDTILQIVSPVSLGWVGFSWGGGMTSNPLTVAWPNGNTGKATVSSRWANGRTLPSTYSSASYKTLSSSKNSTHWTIEVVCTGCSKWTGGQLTVNGNTINTFAWAYSKTAVPQPANPSSSFSMHNNVGMFSDNLSMAKVPQATFQEYVKKAGL